MQIDQGQALRDSVVGVAIGSDAPMGIGVRHGWTPGGQPLLVTKAEGELIFEIDDRPAREAYLGRGPAAAEPADVTEGVLYERPLGTARARGREPAVHVVRPWAGPEGAIRASPPIPQGTLAWPLGADQRAMLAAAEAACAETVAGVGGAPPLGAVAFESVARRALLGDQGLSLEVERIAAGVGGAALAGFYTYGELARTRGLSSYHNYSLVVLASPDRRRRRPPLDRTRPGLLQIALHVPPGHADSQLARRFRRRSACHLLLAI